MNEQTFKVGNTVRLTITDKSAEEGQWFETTVMGVSSKSGILLHLEGFVLTLVSDEGEGFYSNDRVIEKGSLFMPDIQQFCFYSGWNSYNPGDDDYERCWGDYDASLELA